MYDVGKCLLADRLLEAHMTQQELANCLGVSRQLINAYVHNRKRMPLLTAINIAEILRCDVKELYEWIPVKVPIKRR